MPIENIETTLEASEASGLVNKASATKRQFSRELLLAAALILVTAALTMVLHAPTASFAGTARPSGTPCVPVAAGARRVPALGW
jgi:hypothetical protein